MIRLISAVTLPLLAEAIRAVVSRQDDIDLVAEADDPYGTIDLVRRSEPDILILDLASGLQGPLSLLQEIVDRAAGLRVLVLGYPPNDELALRLLRSGAYGYLAQECSSEELLDAVRSVYRGEQHLPADLAHRIAIDAIRHSGALPHAALSNREFEVFIAIARGDTPREIASALGLSVSTVNTHRQRILAKMQMDSNAELIHYAVRHGLLV